MNNLKNNQQDDKNADHYEREILNTASVGVLITQMDDGAILYANKMIARLLGVDDEKSAIGRLVPDFYWERQDRQKVLESFRANGFVANHEIRARRMDGGMIWVSISIQPFEFEGRQTLLSELVDITERKQMEQALRQSEERFHSLYDNATVGLYRTTPDGRILMINPAGLRMLGFDTFEELAQRNLEESGFEIEDSRREFRNKLEKDSVISGLESQWTKKDGSVVFVRESAKICRDENGTILYYDGSFEDITEYKLAEEALRASEGKLRAIYESSNDAIMLLDEKGFFDCNPHTLEMFGFKTKEEFISAQPADISPEYQPEGHDSKSASQEHIKNAYRKGYERFEWMHRRANNEEFPAEVLLSAFRIGGQQVLQATVRDITERKQAEARLSESEARYQLLSESTIEGIVVHDKGILLDTNQNFAAMFGYEIKEVIGMSALNFLTPETREITAQNIRAGYEKPYEVMGLRKNGSSFPVEITGKAVPYQGRILRVAALRDITERKQLESEIKKAFERRGYQVQISNQISQEVSATAKLDELFNRVVTLTKERLGYYHTQLLRYNAEQDAVVLISGYGETGRKMLEGRHKMPMGSGLIGAAAATGETVMRPDLANDPDWKPNPLLPETRGEIAVPIKWQDNILGVLDVQSNQAGALAEDDRLLLEGLCGQIAIAMHSAELVETLRQNETRLAEAAEIAQMGYWEFDLLTDTYTFTDQFYALLRTTAEQEGGYQMSSREYVRKFMPPEAGNMVGNEIQKSLETVDADYVGQFEHRFIRADGTEGYVTGRSRVVKDAQGRTVKTVGFNQDITERKQAEEALESERRLLRVLMSTMLDQIYVKDAAHRFLLVSDAVARSLGAKTTDEVIGKTDFDFHPSTLAEQYHADEKSLMESGLPLIDHEEKILDHITGAYRQLSSTKIPLRDNQGNVIGLVGVNHDITERKQVEEALRVNEARLAEALRTARLANWEYNVEKDLFTFNDQFYAIFHATVETAGGYQISSARYAELFVHPEDIQLVGIEIGKALNSTERVYNTTIDHRIRYADGGIGYITVKVTVERDENGKILRFYGANQDITERKQAEEALRRSEQEMAERLEEINRLYQNLSHEGWKTYRETADLPAGFIFDQSGIKPLESVDLTDGLFAKVPMTVLGGEVVGDLAVANDSQLPMSEDDIAFLQQVSEQVALALEGARLTAQTQSALAQSEKLFEASRILTQAADLQELAASTVKMLGITEINRAVLVTFNYNEKTEIESLDVVANWWDGTGYEATAVGTRYTFDTLLEMSLFVSPQPIFFNDTLNDERADPTTLQLAQRLNLRAVAVLPLYSGAKQGGALILEAEAPHEFTEEEIRLFSALAPQISTVLENRRQFERARQQAEREGLLNTISQKIQSATTVEAVLQIAARELGHALGAPMTIAQLSMKDKK